MGDTKIQWTGKTWNPIRARNTVTGEVGWFCEHVSHGCDNCYAEKMNVNTYFGNGLKYKASNLAQLELFLDEKILEQPLRWRKPTMIFPCSMTDLFGRFVKDEWIDQIFAVMALSPQHAFQVLTKRAERMREYARDVCSNEESANRIRRRINAIPAKLGDRRGALELPLFNVWLGVSVEDQKTADERIPLLLDTPAAVRWISAEPLLGPISFRWATWQPFARESGAVNDELDGLRRLDWVVVGGESGPRARSLDLSWIAKIVRQCKAASVPVFVKQLGYRPWWDGVSTKSPAPHIYLENKVKNGKVGWQFDCMQDRKGGDINEWPEDLRVREFPIAA